MIWEDKIRWQYELSAVGSTRSDEDKIDDQNHDDYDKTLSNKLSMKCESEIDDITW